MSLTHNSGDYVIAAGKASPPLAVTGMGAAGLDLQAWVLVATLIYTILQIFLLVRKYIRERIEERAEKRAEKLKVTDVLLKETTGNVSN